MVSRAGPEMTGRVATEDPARFELVIHGIPGRSRWVFGYVLGNDDMKLDEENRSSAKIKKKSSEKDHLPSGNLT